MSPILLGLGGDGVGVGTGVYEVSTEEDMVEATEDDDELEDEVVVLLAHFEVDDVVGVGEGVQTLDVEGS